MALFDESSKHLSSFPDTAIRVFHGRGKAFEGFEHINVEWYPPFLFVQNFKEEQSDALTENLTRLFQQHPEISAILMQSRGWPDLNTEVFQSRDTVQLPVTQRVALTEDVCCGVSLGKNRNTGVFLDMRQGWDWVQTHAAGKRILNLFCYTGVFSLFALKGGAVQVDNVDMAPNVLKIAQRNHQLNEVHDGRAAFFRRNILKSDRWFENRTPYDLIIIDPPPYQKKAFHGWAHYEQLLDTCYRALAPHGQLFMTLNNPQVSIDEFIHDIARHFPDNQGIEIIPTGDEIREDDPQKGLKVAVVQF